MEYYSYYGIEKYTFRTKISDSTPMGGGITFHNSGHRLALGHLNDMRCLQKVYAFFFGFFTSHQKLSDIKGQVYLG